MFLQRLITTLILVPLVLWLIFYGNQWLLAGIVLLVFFAATRECLQLIPLKNWTFQAGFFVLMFFVCGHVIIFFLIGYMLD